MCEEMGTLERYCSFCLKNGEPEKTYSSHVLRLESGAIQCPVLQRHVCTFCSATGVNAHTDSHCPKKKDGALAYHKVYKNNRETVLSQSPAYRMFKPQESSSKIRLEDSVTRSRVHNFSNIEPQHKPISHNHDSARMPSRTFHLSPSPFYPGLCPASSPVYPAFRPQCPAPHRYTVPVPQSQTFHCDSRLDLNREHRNEPIPPRRFPENGYLAPSETCAPARQIILRDRLASPPPKLTIPFNLQCSIPTYHTSSPPRSSSSSLSSSRSWSSSDGSPCPTETWMNKLEPYSNWTWREKEPSSRECSRSENSLGWSRKDFGPVTSFNKAPGSPILPGACRSDSSKSSLILDLDTIQTMSNWSLDGSLSSRSTWGSDQGSISPRSADLRSNDGDRFIY